METKKREKILLAATGAVAVLWLLNLLVVSPLIDSWRNRAREIVRLKEQLANGVSLVRRESTIRDRWDNMRANALSNNATAAERQLFTAFDHWVTAGGVTEGSFRPQVHQGRQRAAIDAGPEPERFDSDGFRSLGRPPRAQAGRTGSAPGRQHGDQRQFGPVSSYRAQQHF
jgi:hypothetical protein